MSENRGASEKEVKQGKNFVKFKNPYVYEEKEYNGIDLSKLETLTTEQLFDVSKRFSTNEYITPRPEADLKYCCILAAVVCGVPEGFFNHLPAAEGIKVRNAVQSFFQNEG